MHRLWIVLLLTGTAACAQELILADRFEQAGAESPAARAAAFLQRATFGPTESEIAEFLQQGRDQWLTEQFSLEPTLVLPQFWALDLPEDLPEAPDFRTDIWWRTVLTADDQLRQRVAFALSQLFVVSDSNDLLADYADAMLSYYDVLLRNAFGNYRDLLLEVSRHPAMGVYLSHLANEKADPGKNIRPDENYAREVMQLFSIGLVQLNPDGSTVIGVDGVPAPAYGQSDIKELAKVLTGWTTEDTECEAFADWEENLVDPMKSCSEFHETSAKVVLGQIIPAGGTAESDLSAAMDILFNHPNTGPFVVTRLIQRLVTSNPTPAYIKRVANVFADNGDGERGDMKAVINAVLTDVEAERGYATLPSFGALREPLRRWTHVYRVFDARALEDDFSDGLYSNYPEGQRAQSAPSVFNFFAPGYRPPGPLEALSLVAPEFKLESEDLHTLHSNQFDAVVRYFFRGNPDEQEWLEDIEAIRQEAADAGEPMPRAGLITIGYEKELALRDQPEALLRRLDLLLTAGRMPSPMFSVLKSDLEQMFDDSEGTVDDLYAIASTVHQIVQSPAYLIQR